MIISSAAAVQMWMHKHMPSVKQLCETFERWVNGKTLSVTGFFKTQVFFPASPKVQALMRKQQQQKKTLVALAWGNNHSMAWESQH